LSTNQIGYQSENVALVLDGQLKLPASTYIELRCSRSPCYPDRANPQQTV